MLASCWVERTNGLKGYAQYWPDDLSRQTHGRQYALRVWCPLNGCAFRRYPGVHAASAYSSKVPDVDPATSRRKTVQASENSLPGVLLVHLPSSKSPLRSIAAHWRSLTVFSFGDPATMVEVPSQSSTSTQRTAAPCLPAARARCRARCLLPSAAGCSPSSAAKCGFWFTSQSHTFGEQNPHGLLLLNVMKPEKYVSSGST